MSHWFHDFLQALWTIQQLCVPETALFVLVFNVRNPRDAGLLPQWVQMIQSKVPVLYNYSSEQYVLHEQPWCIKCTKTNVNKHYFSFCLQSLGAEIIIAASNCEVSEDSCQNVLDEIKKMENGALKEINEELAILRFVY